MSHHKKIIIKGIDFGHLVITNDGEILQIWINQPWGGELFYPAEGLRNDTDTLEEDDY